MHGLDNIAAEGIEGFQAMKEIINDLYNKSCLSTSECDALQETVNSAKLYFKTDYKLTETFIVCRSLSELAS